MWPEHVQAFQLFYALRTQWRVAMGGPTGLDYNVMYRMMDRMNLDPDAYDELEIQIQTMEVAALDCMREAT